MSSAFELVRPLPGASFGGRVGLIGDRGARHRARRRKPSPTRCRERSPKAAACCCCQDMEEIADDPELLVRLSRVFGTEVEDYRHTLTPLNMVHETVPEIFIVSNMPPVSRSRRAGPIRR